MSRNPTPADWADDAELDAAEVAAADWLLREERGLTATEERELALWLRADPRHARLLARLRATWDLLADVPPGSFPPAKIPPVRKQPWWLTPLAAAAIVVLGFLLLSGSGAKELPALPHRAATEAGGFKTVSLPDGSIVALNADSAIEFDFTPAMRRLHLVRGEANFAVAKDAARPFVVRAGLVEVRAVGTAFNVRLESKAVQVLVTEGRVTVGDPVSGVSLVAAVPLLVAGERVVIPWSADAGAPAPVRATAVGAAEIDRELAWQSRTLEFSDEPLARVVSEFNRYNRHKLVIADAQLGQRRFGGKFPAHDFTSLVSFLEANFGVRAEHGDHETVLRPAR